MENPPAPVTQTSPLLHAAGFRHAFFTRRGGASRPPWDSLNFAVSVGDDAASVQENLRRAARALGVDAARLYMLSQVHGTASRELTGVEDRVRGRARGGRHHPLPHARRRLRRAQRRLRPRARRRSRHRRRRRDPQRVARHRGRRCRRRRRRRARARRLRLVPPTRPGGRHRAPHRGVLLRGGRGRRGFARRAARPRGPLPWSRAAGGRASTSAASSALSSRPPGSRAMGSMT